MAHANILNILSRIIPMLKERGVSDAQLEKIFVTNPATVLSWRHLFPAYSFSSYNLIFRK